MCETLADVAHAVEVAHAQEGLHLIEIKWIELLSSANVDIMLFNSKIFVLGHHRDIIGVLLAPRSLEDLFSIGDELCLLWFGTHENVSLIALSTVVDFWCNKNLEAQERTKESKRWLWVSLATNRDLGFFKYYDFFVSDFVLLMVGLGTESRRLSLKFVNYR